MQRGVITFSDLPLVMIAQRRIERLDLRVEIPLSCSGRRGGRFGFDSSKASDLGGTLSVLGSRHFGEIRNLNTFGRTLGRLYPAAALRVITHRL